MGGVVGGGKYLGKIGFEETEESECLEVNISRKCEQY